jgi:hypothetical protein
MSTKLTAKKRYLPRIKKGVVEFNQLTGSSSSAEISKFVNEESTNLVRAMGLFGVSDE